MIKLTVKKELSQHRSAPFPSAINDVKKENFE